MELIPKHWPTPTSADTPSPVLNQTVDALFAWAYVASFAAWLPFLAAASSIEQARRERQPAAPSLAAAGRAK